MEVVAVVESVVSGTYTVPALGPDTVCDLCRGCREERPGEDLSTVVCTREVTAIGT